jgi:hypothetical protein
MRLSFLVVVRVVNRFSLEYGVVRALVLVADHSDLLIVLVVSMLEKLAQLTKGLCTVATIVRKFRDTGRSVAAILQHGHVAHEALHDLLLTRKAINGIARIVLAKAAAAITALHMLHGIGAGSKTLLAAKRGMQYGEDDASACAC